MFDSIRSLFYSEASKQEFEGFLQQFLQSIHEKHNVGYLGKNKAMHRVAEILGFKNAHVLDALSSQENPNAGFYLLHYVERPTESRDSGIQKMFPTWQAAVSELWEYVADRIVTCAGDAFLEEYEDLLEEYQYLEDIDPYTDTQKMHEFLSILKWNDIAESIDWYFNYMDDEICVVKYDITYFKSSSDKDGSYAGLTAAYDDEYGHPLLDAKSIKVVDGGYRGGRLRYKVVGLDQLAGQLFDTQAIAVHEALKIIRE